MIDGTIYTLCSICEILMLVYFEWDGEGWVSGLKSKNKQIFFRKSSELYSHSKGGQGVKETDLLADMSAKV